ncbi:TetR/AcrR family transcriptional regulator [Phenylobacterium sp.]|uniref:TetR/AcrR family transcriptional regulator n=1 Tax=Phenylobacterium sp. TaxID=1871053 RepID=UPI0025F3A075|nr:TetR/AcrR family transcriptional regulator [Phenylobacterium sp.]
MISNGWAAAEAERAQSRLRQRELKLRALVSVASVMLNKHGYEGLSLADVASVLNITKQALYHYTSSKEDLLLKCYERALDLAEAAYDHADGAGTNGLEKIEHFVKFHINPNAETYAILDNLGALTDEHRKAISGRAKQLEQRMRGYIREGMADGSIAPVDPKFTEFWILGSLSWMPKWFDPQGDLSADEVAQSFITLISDGLRPRG